MFVSIRRKNGRTLLRILTCSLPLISCKDSPTEADRVTKLAVPGEGHASISDPGINFNDTWVSTTTNVADTTIITTDQPFTDPTTEQQTTTMSWPSEPTTVDVIAGYGYSGELRVTTGYATDNDAETQVVQQIGNATGDADQSGAASSEPLEIEPMADLGPLQDAQVDPTPPPNPDCPRQETAGCVSSGALMAPPQTAPAIVFQNQFHLRTVQTLSGRDATRRTNQTASKLAAVPGVALPSVEHVATVTKDYEKRGDTWLLRHVLNLTVITGPHGKLEHRQHYDFTRMEYFKNPVLDAARTVRRLTQDTATVLPNSGRGVIIPSIVIGGKQLALSVSTCNPEGDPNCCPETADQCNIGGEGGGGGSGGFGPSGYYDPPAPDETVGSGSDYAAFSGEGSTTVVFQHGFMSSAETFERMDTLVALDMNVAGRHRESLNWRNSYENQSVELRQKLSAATHPPSGPTVLIGHSNGGMVSRYLARHPSGLPIAGVITIGTPHLGTPAASHAVSMNYLLGIAGGTGAVLCWFTQGGGCRQIFNITTSGVNRSFKALIDPWPVVSEMQPRSLYHSSFNSEYEDPASRFGIQSYSWSKWQLWRIWGDSYCYPRSSCGGFKMVKKADRTFHHDVTCAVAGWFIGRAHNAVGCAADGAFMKLFDNLYRRNIETEAALKDEFGDGFVPGWSQKYPNVPAPNQFAVHDGPSHMGETKDECITKQTETILLTRFNVTRKRSEWLCPAL